MSTTVTATDIWFVGTRAHVVVSSEETEGRLSIVEVTGARGEMPPLHVHHTDDEVFHLLDGELTLYHGTEAIRLRAGQTGLAPRGVPHTFRIESDGGARALVVSAPGGFDRYVAAIGVPAGGPGLPPEPIAPDLEAAAALAAETGYEVELLGPPGALPA
jgi:quercetin dioxygenase-like cupin family protein